MCLSPSSHQIMGLPDKCSGSWTDRKYHFITKWYKQHGSETHLYLINPTIGGWTTTNNSSRKMPVPYYGQMDSLLTCRAAEQIAYGFWARRDIDERCMR